MKRPTCNTCPYAGCDFAADGDPGPNLLCRLNPPALAPIGNDGGSAAVWPWVGHDDFCGRHPCTAEFVEKFGKSCGPYHTFPNCGGHDGR